jgi:hypothetical protein
VRLEGLCKFKNKMASSGIELSTFRLVAQCLDKLRYRMLQLTLASPFHSSIKCSVILLDKTGSRNDALSDGAEKETSSVHASGLLLKHIRMRNLYPENRTTLFLFARA